jgi:hypothetical protein
MRFTSRLWDYRYFRVLNHFVHSQGIMDEQISRHPDHLGYYSTGRDGILPVDVCLPIDILHFLVCCRGR